MHAAPDAIPGPASLDWRSPAALPPALAVLPGPKAALACADGVEALAPAAARSRLKGGPALVAHAALTARRLGLPPPARSRDLLDVLELFAFVRPAHFAAPSAAGLARAMGLAEPRGAAAQAETLREIAAALLEELAARPVPTRDEALAVAETLARAGLAGARWRWPPSPRVPSAAAFAARAWTCGAACPSGRRPRPRAKRGARPSRPKQPGPAWRTC